ncbi:type 2 lantipeptide synthetase LanM [Blastococcus sp. CT_GayMR20]|uniref:type 2 lanthipeptide synthetase LanM family protein n=1 Tax=Blastococcus sp. CT_GayMR20 TaxID=2559609 RepID=UPI0010731030|nr:type 2 lanthipeptide synthetase LanM family protein [Blastococcus sp. CT_GayMR20]TFV74259.1 type 2 lantipeptide synthetase LanM [Blastococcus sp. CT_GayMR20]
MLRLGCAVIDSDRDRRIQQIAARGLLLQEQVDGHVTSEGGQPGIGPELLERWRRAVEPQGTAWFDKRLRWGEPWTFAPGAADARQWPDVLRELCRSAPLCLHPGMLRPDRLRPGGPVPFEELLLPTVHVGRRRLLERLRRDSGTPEEFPVDVMTMDAYLGLEHALLDHVSWLSEEALAVEFRGTSAGRALTAALGFPATGTPSRERYDAFVHQYLEAGWLPLLEKYPVLGRLVATSVVLWVDATAELVGRLRTDRDELSRSFGIREHVRVARFDGALGDRHRGGRSVTSVLFDDGGLVVYKPKPLAMEARFNELVDWFNDAGATPPLRSTTVLDRGDYGWTEYVDDRECTTADDVSRYYTRAGMLLAVLHLLRATDCHYENLIAHGDQPVLVDAETLMYPDPRPLDAGESVLDGEGLRDQMLGVSVLRVGLLPQWRLHAGVAYDNSGLAAATRPSRGDQDAVHVWTDVNTDAMRRIRARPEPTLGRHVVRLDGRPQSVLDHAEHLVDGFRSAYRLLASRRRELLDPLGPLERMRSCPTRFIHRATRFYAALLAGSRQPEQLRSGVDLGLYLEQLARPFLAGPTRPALWPVFHHELRAAARLDVPLLTTRPDTRDLHCGDGTRVRDAFRRAAYDTVLDQLQLFDEGDLARQVRVIEASLAARVGRRQRPRPPAPSLASPLGCADRPDLLAAALDIGRAIEATAITDGAGAVNWIGLQYLDEGDCHEIDVLNDFLYDGVAGVAVFLAALFRSTGDAKWADLALRALGGPRRRLRAVEPSARQMTARLRGIGAGSGLGSLLYAMSAVAGHLEGTDAAPALLADATSLAHWFTPATIAADDRLDVLGGGAGALLALLALHRATGDPDVLARALDCGEHLVSAGSYNGNVEPPSARLTGFAHGAAGLAFALARLSAATSEHALLGGALEHLEYERARFSAEHDNWPDLRPRLSEAGPWPVKWCHGAAGITLSRLGILRVVDDPALRSEIVVGLRTTRRNYLQDLDSLCCGNMGRVEVFAVAADVLDAADLHDLARSGAEAVLVRRVREKDFQVFPGEGLHHPGLFPGTAGIGYQLLRVHDPRLPSVLLWD